MSSKMSEMSLPSTLPSASLVSSLKLPSLASYPTVYEPSSLISLTCLTMTTGSSVVVEVVVVVVEGVVVEVGIWVVVSAVSLSVLLSVVS